MKTTITLLEDNFDVEWDFNITASGSPECGPSYSSGGEPAEPVEFDLEVISIEFSGKKASGPLDFPDWLKQLVLDHLYNRDDVYAIVAEADSDSGDYNDDWRD